jgi:hypothetical protein
MNARRESTWQAAEKEYRIKIQDSSADLTSTSPLSSRKRAREKRFTARLSLGAGGRDEGIHSTPLP